MRARRRVQNGGGIGLVGATSCRVLPSPAARTAAVGLSSRTTPKFEHPHTKCSRHRQTLRSRMRRQHIQRPASTRPEGAGTARAVEGSHHELCVGRGSGEAPCVEVVDGLGLHQAHIGPHGRLRYRDARPAGGQRLSNTTSASTAHSVGDQHPASQPYPPCPQVLAPARMREDGRPGRSDPLPRSARPPPPTAVLGHRAIRGIAPRG